MTTLDGEFKHAIADYLERSGTSLRKLCELALDDPGFLAEMKRGHSPRLDVVDRMLGFMGISPIGPRFRREVEAFLIVARVRTGPTTLGIKAVGNPPSGGGVLIEPSLSCPIPEMRQDRSYRRTRLRSLSRSALSSIALSIIDRTWPRARSAR